MDAEVSGDLFQRDAGLAVARDPYDVLAELLRIRLGHCDILPGRLSASQVRCHLSVQQSLHTILEEMKARGGTDKAIAEEMARALRRQKVQYVMVQANKHTGSYAGAELSYFDLYREGR
ncbi:hypothetical protein [Streptomyces sp. NPDC000877]|uniref:hypothetical protein n=1 Tax=unclassified Streptomyces TaxID=2593676 RepID=UPI0033224A48